MANLTGFSLHATLSALMLAAFSDAGATLVEIPGQCVHVSDVSIASVPLTLKNLPGVRVVVSDRFASGQDISLAKSLRSDIEQVLTRVGIRILSGAEWSRAAGHPSLHFDVQNPSDASQHGVVMELKEAAFLERRPKISTSIVNYRVETSYDLWYPVSQPRILAPMQEADSIRAAIESKGEDCATQEIQALHDLARELAAGFVGAYRYQNRSRRVK